MKFGGIERSATLAGYTIVNSPVTKLPQKVATALGAINENRVGAQFNPIRYVGYQLVNGMNHMFIAEEVRSTAEQKKLVVALVINIPIGDHTGEKARVVDVIEEAELPEEVAVAFNTAISTLQGVNYKPLVYIGKQVVKGINYYVIASAQVVAPGSEPYAALLGINAFNGEYNIVSIEHIEDVEAAVSDDVVTRWP